jgi:hypothetical protein
MYSCARARARACASPFAIAKNTTKRWKILASINRSLGKKSKKKKKKTVTNDLMMTFTPAHVCND